MSEHCTHDLHEREMAVALDGYCPLCQAADNAALRARVTELEEEVKRPKGGITSGL